MKLQPRNNRILIEQVIFADTKILMPEGVANPIGHWHVHAVAPGVEVCKAGDDVIIRPDAHLYGVDDMKRIGLADAGVVFAVVTETEKSEFEV